jgi:hypothetical protein
MKGQFFIVGAILVCSLFFAGLPKFAPIISQPSGDLTYISSNLNGELPHALNIGLNDSDPIGRMENFTHFLERSLLDRNINFTSLWLVVENQSSNLNVTGGNFLGEDVAVTINVTDSSGSTVQPLVLLNGTVNSTTVSSVDQAYNITVTFFDQEESAEYPRDKVSLYAFYRLTRGDDLIQNHVFG